MAHQLTDQKNIHDTHKARNRK